MINSRNLDDLRPDVAANCRVWLARCAAGGLNVLVTQTLRDNEYQAALYARGRTKPGSIVTNAKTTSFHGRGLAFDFCRNVKGREYDDPAFFREAAALAKELGFSWGGDWRSFVDRPHIQWDDGGRFSDAMVRAGKLPPAMPLCKTKEEDEDMDISKLTDQECWQILEKAQRFAAALPLPVNWDAAGALRLAVDAGITDGKRPMAPATRLEAAIMAQKAARAG